MQVQLGSRVEAFRQIWGVLGQVEKAYLAAGAVVLLAASCTELLAPPIAASALFVVVNQGSRSDLLIRAAMLALVGAVCGVLHALRGYCFHVARNRFVRRLRNLAFSSLLRRDMGFHDQADEGELTARLTGDCQIVFRLLDDALNFLLKSGVVTAVGTASLVSISPRVTVSVAAVLAALVVCTERYSQVNRGAAQRTQDALARLNRIAGESLKLLRTVRALNAEGKHRRQYAAQNFEVFEIQRRRGYAMGLFYAANGMLTTMVRAVALLAGSLLVGTGHALSGEALATYLLYLDMVVDSALELGVEWSSAMEALGSGERVLALASSAPTRRSGTRRLDTVHGEIALKGVSFAYPSRPTRTVLKDVSIECRAGQTTALVGASGSGKSSLVNLVQRLYEVAGGTITLDGADILDLDPSWLRRQLGVVGQQPRLFKGTVAENIAWGLEGATDDEIRAAAATAYADEFISRLPLGYDTVISDANKLSGGQRQRIAIARALIRDPPVLILDEPTAALDPQATELLSKALQRAQWSPRLGRQRTVIVIAHRLSTVEHADQIVVFQEGVVAERGTHQELMTRAGVYARLVADQRLPTGHTPHI